MVEGRVAAPRAPPRPGHRGHADRGPWTRGPWTVDTRTGSWTSLLGGVRRECASASFKALSAWTTYRCSCSTLYVCAARQADLNSVHGPHPCFIVHRDRGQIHRGPVHGCPRSTSLSPWVDCPVAWPGGAAPAARRPRRAHHVCAGGIWGPPHPPKARLSSRVHDFRTLKFRALVRSYVI